MPEGDHCFLSSTAHVLIKSVLRHTKLKKKKKKKKNRSQGRKKKKKKKKKKNKNINKIKKSPLFF